LGTRDIREHAVEWRDIRYIGTMRLLLALLAVATFASGCVTGEDEYYQYRTVTYSVSVVGPHDTFTVWYREGRDIREAHPESQTWETTVSAKFNEAVDIELRADAYVSTTQSVPVRTEITCEIAVDGTSYSKNTYSHTAACKVGLDEVASAPKPAPDRAADGTPSFVTPVLWLGAALALVAVVAARWMYVRRRKARGAWPPR
jgi:hypothetical protein